MIVDTNTRRSTVPLIVVMFATALGIADDDSAKNLGNQADAKPLVAKNSETPPSPESFGVLLNDARALPGYNLINPGRNQTYLYDNDGRVVHIWTSEHRSGAAAYLLDNGHLF